jgi:hypothetical protein
MDRKTYDWIKDRTQRYEQLGKELADLRYKRSHATESGTQVCPVNDYGQPYKAGIPFPDEARQAVIAALDALIAATEHAMEEL